MKIDDTILRQYGNSQALKSIIYSFDDGIKIDMAINKFFDEIFNLDTAKGYGLDCWGKIVNVSRYVKYEKVGDVLGFDGQKLQTFNYGSFYSGKKVTQTIKLTDDFFRIVIKAKASANISSVTIEDTNRILRSLYADKGKPFITDNQDMSMNYVFPFYLADNEKALIKNSNILPRPSGVKLRAIITAPAKTFGFFGSGCQTFNHGSFINRQGVFNVN